MTLTEFENYFRLLAASHVDIDDFVWGDAFEQLQELITNLGDVVMIVDSPDFGHNNHDFTGRSLNDISELVILKLTQKDDKSRKQSDLEATKEIILEVIRKIESDYTDNRHYKFDLKSIIQQSFLTNRIGYRVKFELAYDVPVDINPTKWQ